MTHDELVATAAIAREQAYAPYSNFKVGAALLGKSGKVHTGCNVENAADGPGICAQRTAIFKVVSEREGEFELMAVVSQNGASTIGGLDAL